MTGMPVHIATTWAMSSAVTTGLSSPCFGLPALLERVSELAAQLRLALAVLGRQLVLLGGDRRSFSFCDALERPHAPLCSEGGAEARCMRTRLAASSTRSMALSGMKRSGT